MSAYRVDDSDAARYDAPVEDGVMYSTNIAVRDLHRGWGDGRRTVGVRVDDLAFASRLRREGR